MRTQSTLVVVLVAVSTVTMGLAPLGASQATEKTQQEPAALAAAPTEDRRDRNHRLPLDADRPHDGVDRPDRLDDEAPVPRPNPNQRQAQPAQGLAPDEPGCLPHPPIRIVDDAMFQLGPAVGVTNPTAAGTAEDPYVIEGWCITPQDPEIVEQAPFGPVESAGIAIENTEAHVVIRDNRIDGNAVDVPRVATQQQHGIELDDAANVAIEHNTITNNDDDGVLLEDSSGATIANNTIMNNAVDGVDLYRSSGATIANNTITNNGVGVVLVASSGATIANNTIMNNAFRGVDLDESSGATIANNTIMNNAVDGVVLVASSGATIANNTITNNAVDGVDLYRSSGVEVHQNNIHDNDGVGLEVFGGDTVHAENNWWGAANGPSGGEDDACTDATADGDGDPIYPIWGGDVCFAPWRTSPNPDAGAGD